MDFFQKYSSNSIGAGANQKFFSTAGETYTGRVFYRVTVGGKFNYSFLFSGIIDSTYADGNESHADYVCDSWAIKDLQAAVCTAEDFARFGGNGDYAFQPVTFNGKRKKEAAPGEFFYTDPMALSCGKGDYICLQITFTGNEVPYHEESMLSLYRLVNGTFVEERKMPVASMVGCDRPVRVRLGFLGDSITQGIGVPAGTYAHWTAFVTEMLPADCAAWNLGIGFGRAQDCARDGAWLFKAKQCDAVAVCFGVNDIYRGRGEKNLTADLEYIVDTLKAKGIKVLLQTVPPFDYYDNYVRQFLTVNDFIRNTLSEKADVVFDCVPVLGKGEKLEKSAYNPHPDAVGCGKWAKALMPSVFSLIGAKVPAPPQMPAALREAVLVRKNENVSVAAFDGKTYYKSEHKGVAPLLSLLEQGKNLNGYCASDRVVGSGAAFLYVLLGVKAVQGDVMTLRGAEILQSNGIEVYADLFAVSIVNRSNTGICPVEEVAIKESEPNEAYKKILQRVREMAK